MGKIIKIPTKINKSQSNIHCQNKRCPYNNCGICIHSNMRYEYKNSVYVFLDECDIPTEEDIESMKQYFKI